jgi:tetratricopeptide (TPR) repeat protein
MRRTAIGLAGLALLAGCQTPLERGDRLYREGDRLAALETWRGVPDADSRYPQARARIAVVEEESQQLAVRYRQRGHYFEEKGRLAESILDYRLALKLQPDDAETLERVQVLARSLAAQKAELGTAYADALAAGDLAGARRSLAALRELDAFDPELETDERTLRGALRAEVARGLEAGRKALSAGDLPLARHELRGVLALDPDNESARGYLAYAETVERQAAKSGSAGVPDPFASEAEIRAEGLYRNALAAEESGDLYEAIRHDVKALRADPQHRRAQVHLAHLRERLAFQVEPLIEQGREAFQKDDLQTALDAWRLALLIDPSNERTRAYIARVERQLANLESLRSEPGVAAKPK